MIRSKRSQKSKSLPKALAVDQHIRGKSVADSVIMPAAADTQPSGPDSKSLSAKTCLVNAVYHCNVCQLYCSSRINLKQHIKGRRHAVHVFLGALLTKSVELQQDKFDMRIRVIRNGIAVNEIEIVENVSVLRGKQHEVIFALKNEGQQNVYLGRCVLLKPVGFRVESNHLRNLNPGEQSTVTLKCSREHVSCFSTVVVFKLTHEQSVEHVIRKVTVHIEDPLLKDLAATAPYRKPPKRSLVKTVTKIIDGLQLDASHVDDYLEKLVSIGKFNIPQKVRQAVNYGLYNDTTGLQNISVVNAINSIRNILEEGLNATTHHSRFSHLLFIEEIQMEVDIRKYDLHNVLLENCKENKRLLTLEVPGLLEKRPSVLRGDSLFVIALQADGKPETCEYKGYVHQVLEKQVWLGFSERLRKKWLPNMRFNCRFSFNRLPQQLQHRSIQLVLEHGLESFLFPTDDTVCQRQPIALDKREKFFNPDIEGNSQQVSAVRNILTGTSRPAPFLVFGPPGTGKTVTLVEAMLQVMDRIPSAHILACAPSNSAADLIAKRVLEKMSVKSKLYRLCAASRDWNSVPVELKEYCNFNTHTHRFLFPSKSDLMEKTIIVSTLVTAGRLVSANFPSKHFTHVFIDEAGQATEPEALIAIAGIFESDLVVKDGGQVVLAGDPEQLGPVLRSPIAIQCGLDKSLLERYMKQVPVYQRKPDGQQAAYDWRVLVKLVRNYRSHPAILHLPNEMFYDNELEPCADQVARESLCQWEELPAKNCPLIFHGVIGKDEREERSPSFFNVDEISVVKHYLDSLLRKSAKIKVKQSDIGIISPYRKQVQKIQRLLKKSNYDEVTVGSVEEFQGQERRVIIISTVRSNTAQLPLDYLCKLGFLKNPKRFNVALTRAKALLIVIGNPHLLVQDDHWRGLLQYCKDRGAYVGCEFDLDILESEDDMKQLERQLKELDIAGSLDIDPALIGDVTQQLEPEWQSNM